MSKRNIPPIIQILDAKGWRIEWEDGTEQQVVCFALHADGQVWPCNVLDQFVVESVRNNSEVCYLLHKGERAERR